MPARPRFGDLLISLTSISGHDVEEILHEQTSTRRRFGEIALAWGLCRPEHVWNAWCNQLAQSGEMADLDSVAIDARAIECVSPQMARELQILPIRLINDHLIIAAADMSVERSMPQLSQQLGKKLRFVHVDRAQLNDRLATHYPAPV